MKPPVAAAAATPSTSNAGDQLNEDITAQGLKVRDLKANKAEKADVTAAVAILLDLKDLIFVHVLLLKLRDPLSLILP